MKTRIVLLQALRLRHSRRTILILLPLFSLLVFGDPVNSDIRGQGQSLPNTVEPKSCQCGEIFDSLVAKIKANYVGYHQTQIGKRASEFRQFAISTRRRAERTTPDKCVVVLQDFVRFFRDGHLFINQSPQLTDSDVDRLTEQAEQTHLSERGIRRYLELNASRLDPIEGIWYNREGHRFGIVRDSKTAARDFVAVILSEGVERWKPGQVKAEFTKLPDGSYTNVFYSSRHFPLRLGSYSRGRLGGAALRRNGQLLHMPPVTWGKTYPQNEDEQNPIDPVDPRRPTIRKHGTSTIIVSVPSHSPEYIPNLNSLVEKFRDQILKSENLIIDIRGNEGGSSGTTRVLMPFLVTASKHPSRYWVGGQTMVLASEDNIAYFERIFDQGWIPKGLIPRMRSNLGKIVPFDDADTASGSSKNVDEELPLPRNVAILMDRAVVSAGEAFVINAMKNKKVSLFGENTGGVIDYQSTSIITIPGCKSLGLNLGYPMFAASQHLPRGGVNRTGITPDVRIGSNVKSPIDFIVKHYAGRTGAH